MIFAMSNFYFSDGCRQDMFARQVWVSKETLLIFDCCVGADVEMIRYR